MLPIASESGPRLTALASLQRFVPPRAVRERCELCNAELVTEHDHLIELASRQVVCACEPCAILFSGQTAARYRRVPRRSRFLPDFQLSDVAWEELAIPINLAFLLRNGSDGRILAFYPSPAGATEAQVPAEAWEALAEENPVLLELEPDVEALLINRVGESRECYRAGIDACYRLVGLIRTHWRGLSGGTEVWREIGHFFDALRGHSSHA